MKKLASIWKSGPAAQLTLIAAIFVFSFLTFNILFRASEGDGYFQEIIAALIGTILAAVITTMLLRSQTKGEELRERNIEVFRKKVDAYEQFLDQALKHTEDWELSDNEVHQLRRSVYRLSLFSSEETIDTVTKFVRAQYVQDDNCDISDLISSFRKELALENVDELAGWDMEAVDTFLQTSDRSSLKDVQITFKKFISNALDEITDRGAEYIVEGMELSDTFGSGNSICSELQCPSGISYNLKMSYSDDEYGVRLVEGFLNGGEMAHKARPC